MSADDNPPPVTSSKAASELTDAELTDAELTDAELTDAEMDDVAAGFVTFHVSLDAVQTQASMSQSAGQHAAQLAAVLSSGLKTFGG